MELNAKQRKELLRERTAEFLKGLPEGQRIQIDKDKLEYLLFDELIWNEEKNIKIKFPIWSGEFLSKIDLSKVDFDDVTWGFFDKSNIQRGIGKLTYYLDKEEWGKISKLAAKLPQKTHDTNENTICYRNTNARIDFSKSFEAKNIGRVIMRNCDFSGTDLIKNVLTSGTIDKCNLANTNLCLSLDDSELHKRNFIIRGTDLTGIDLGNLTINASDLCDSYHSSIIFDGHCNFTNTALNIMYDSDNPELDSYMKTIFREQIMPNLGGCRINEGKRLLTKEELKELRENKIKEYEEYKDEIANSFIYKLKKDNGIK